MSKNWMTQEAYDKLEAELAELKGPVRADIVHKIDAARQEGDLSENGGYHAARDEQAKNEARIQQMEDLLRNAEIGAAPADDGIVEPGMVVEAKVGKTVMKFLLGSRAANQQLHLDIEVYSPDAPIGKALNGHKVGDKVMYKAPNGKEIPVVIVSAVPFKG
ncbi:MAG: transcription elongation factor GreA [Actinomycetaceae bacterium]|nr:transcription elongation factor GreA [Actinomycetaceae bacterium]